MSDPAPGATTAEPTPVRSPLPGDAHDAQPPADEPQMSVTELAIEGYDDLAARQVIERLRGLNESERSQIAAYERTHRNRSTVLGMIARLAT